MQMFWLRVPRDIRPACAKSHRRSNTTNFCEWRRNLGQLGVLFWSITEIPGEFSSPNELASREQLLRPQGGRLSQFLPYIHTARKLNFTLRSVPDYDMEGLFRTRGTIQTEQAAVDIGGDSVNSVVTIFLRDRTSDTLIFVADAGAQNPLYLPSLRKPFPWYFWIGLFVSTSLNVAMIVRKSKPKDVGEAIIPCVWSLGCPSANLYPARIVLLDVTLDVACLVCQQRLLESLQIKPSVSVMKTTFQDLVDRQFRIYSNQIHIWTCTTRKRYWDWEVLKTPLGIIWSLQTEKENGEYLTLARMLESMNFANSTEHFWKLEQNSLLESQELVSALQNVLLDKFEQNYHILQKEFNSMPTWIRFNVPHGDEILDV